MAKGKEDAFEGKKQGLKEHEVKSCRHCGRMYRYHGYGYGYCENCTVIDNETFHKVKDYIWENGAASGTEVSEVLGVSIQKIYGYLREGRLEIPENSPIYIRCEICSKEIRFGRYCKECGTQLLKDFSGTVQIERYEIGEEPKRKGKIHFLKDVK